jgi:hypothetical protein
MKKHLIYLLAFGFILITGCQKELSFERPTDPAEGSLQEDASGDCLPKTINGTYAVGVALVPTTNTVVVQVNVTKTGPYEIGTDTVNGYYFRATGTFTTLGANNVTLRGNGTPFAVGVNNFVASFDSTFCDFQVTVASAAVYTLAGAPNTCTSATVAGAYAVGVPLTASNTVTLNVNVTTAGAYNITTTYQGMTFAKSGVFTGTGAQTVQLVGSGTPTTAGANVVPVTAGSSTCSFTVTVGAAGAGTLGGAGGACAPINVQGTYAAGIALDATNKVDVQVNVTTPGVFNITTNTVDGFSFSFSGNIAASGTQTVTLQGTGTPTTSGTKNFTVTLGTSTCTFTVNVTGAAAAVYTLDCANAVVNGAYQVGTALNAGNTIVIPVTVTTAGTYTLSGSVGGMTFSSSGSLTLSTTSITLNGTGTPTTAGSNLLTVGTCTIDITVTPATSIDWRFTVGATTYQGSTVLVDYDVSSPPFTLLDYYGDNVAADDFNIALLDLAGGITNGETYNSNSTGTTNAGFFYFTDAAGTLDLAADPGEAGVNIILTVTSHNTATKTITGTFSGTARDYVSGMIKTVTAGTFTAVYP